MRKILRGLKSPNNWLPIIPIVFFFVIVAGGIISQNSIAIITNGLDIGGTILLDFALIPVWFKLLRRDKHAPEAFLFGGILTCVNSIAASRVWSLAIIMSGKPGWMINHWFQSFCYLMFGLGIFYLLKVPGEDGPKGLRYVAYGLVLSVIVMVLFLLQVEN